MKTFKFSALFATTALFVSACAVAPAMNEQETQIKADLETNRYLPASRQMRDAIETQELFAQAAFWSNEYDLNPGDLEAAIKLAAAVRKLGNPNRAVEITQTTRALYPRDPYLLAEYAAALIASERSFEAMQPLDEALAMTPAYGRLWSLKGAALDQQERYVEARQFYNRALQITPNDPNVLANIGFSYALSGDAATAEGWLRKAAAMPGASPSILQNLALVLQLQGKTEEAEKMVAMNRGPQSFTSRPTATMRSQSTQAAMPLQSADGIPQARFTTNSPSGQNFSSASDAVRAMANRPAAAQTMAADAPTVSVEQQQAMLERIARSLNPQAQSGSPAPTQQQAPQYAQPASAQTPPYAPQGYGGQPVMVGGPPAQPARREASRRRR